MWPRRSSGLSSFPGRSLLNVRRALIRATRTMIQALIPVAIAFFSAVGADGSFAGIEAHAKVLSVGLFVAVGAGLTSLMQNLIEDRANLNIPKG